MPSQVLQRRTFFSESKPLLALSIPLIMSGVVETSVGFFSNVFLAHLGNESLAAGALVNWVFTTIMVIVWGTFSAVTTLVARYYGEENPAQIRCVLFAGLFLALILMPPSIILLWNLAPIFLFFGQKPSIVAQAQPYLHGLTWAIIPDFIITILLQFVSGIGRTKINLAFSIIFVPICLFFNYGLMFGKFALPSLGIAGIGWGTAIAFWITTIGFVIYFYLDKSYQIYLKFPRWQKIVPALKEIIKVGLPLGLLYFVEVGFFLAMTVIMGFISAKTLSANQVALQFYWLFSIVTFALAQGVTIRVGHVTALNDRKAIHYATYLGALYGCAFMLLAGIWYWFFPEQLISIDFRLTPENATIIHLAKEFLAIAAFVQIVEAMGFAFFGALRGLKDTNFTLFTSFFTYWLLTLPLGYVLAIMFNMGGYGIWWATLIGQIVGTPMLMWRYHHKMRKRTL